MDDIYFVQSLLLVVMKDNTYWRTLYVNYITKSGLSLVDVV